MDLRADTDPAQVASVRCTLIERHSDRAIGPLNDGEVLGLSPLPDRIDRRAHAAPEAVTPVVLTLEGATTVTRSATMAA